MARQLKIIINLFSRLKIQLGWAERKLHIFYLDDSTILIEFKMTEMQEENIFGFLLATNVLEM